MPVKNVSRQVESNRLYDVQSRSLLEQLLRYVLRQWVNKSTIGSGRLTETTPLVQITFWRVSMPVYDDG